MPFEFPPPAGKSFDKLCAGSKLNVSLSLMRTSTKNIKSQKCFVLTLSISLSFCFFDLSFIFNVFFVECFKCYVHDFNNNY